jgi:hypothetical protein
MRRSSLAAWLPSMAFSDSHIGPNGPSLPSRSRLLWSFFLATHNRPLPRRRSFASKPHSVSVPDTFGNALANEKGVGLKARDQAR